MRNKFINILQVSIVSLAFFILTYGPVNDPDFGWHLRAGMYYLDRQTIPAQDIFSWTAPQYPWVNHEYAADAAYALLYRLAGNTTVLLSFLFAAIAAYLFLSVLPRLCVPKPGWKQRFLIGFPALLMTKPFFGVRSQVFDWLAIALILLFWQKYTATGNKKILWGFPFLFLVWANIHGGFPLGLFMLAGLMFFYLLTKVERDKPFSLRAMFARLFQNQRNTIFFFLAILSTSFLATLLTAYHYRLYTDLLRTSQGKEAFQFIAEWAASTVGTPSAIPFFCYIFLLILLLLGERKQQQLSFQDVLFFLFFLFFALSYVRFIPLFVVVSLPIAYRRFANHQLMPEALAFVVLAGFIITQVSFFTSSQPAPAVKHTPFVSSPFDIRPKAFYSDIPIDALAWLKTRKLPPAMFNDYGWGGEIIWQLPNQPVFIDGRMPHWHLNGRSLLQDYATIERVKPKWYDTIQRYDIQWFFIRSDSSLAAALEQLSDKWEKKYQDGQASVFFRK